MESTNIERQASRLIKKLRQYGCNVVETRKAPRRAVINITHPTQEMSEQATRIKQTLNGVTTEILTLNMDGCTVRWEGGQQCLH